MSVISMFVFVSEEKVRMEELHLQINTWIGREKFMYRESDLDTMKTHLHNSVCVCVCVFESTVRLGFYFLFVSVCLSDCT